MTAPQIGHNRSPFDVAQDAVETVYCEAQHWLDGATVTSQAEADAIGQLLDMARKAKKAADEARVIEKKPHDDAADKVQARYKPLLAKCSAIADAAKKALQPFLIAQEAAKRERERIAREAAEAAQQAAREAMAARTDLASVENAERLADDAKRAEIAARMAAKDTGRAKGGARAVSLRRVEAPEIANLHLLLAWIWEHDRSALEGFAQSYVEGAYRAGQRGMAGVETVIKETVA